MLDALFISIALIFSSSAEARTVTDSLGARVELVERPARVVTLVPSVAELAAEILSEDLGRIVGVSEYTDYPPTLKSRPSVGRYDRFSIERVLSMKPDLVLATSDGNSEDQIKRLRELKLPVVVVSAGDLASVSKSMILVADALGMKERGEQMARQFEAGLTKIRERAAKRENKSVLMQVGADPLVVVGGKSFLNDAMELVRARNVYADRPQGYPRPALEDVLKRNPDQIIVVALSPDDKTVETAAKSWLRFPRMKAVAAKQVKILRADSLVRPSLRLLEGLSLLEKAVHGP